MPPAVDRLRTLLRSRHPIITIDTDEEPRAIAAVMQAAAAVGRTVYVWNMIDGMHSAPPAAQQAIVRTLKPVEVLASIMASDWPAAFILMDFCTHLSKDPALQRLLRKFAQGRGARPQTIVLIDSDVTLPDALVRWSVPVNLPLPDEAEIEQIVRETIADLGRYVKIDATLSKRDFRHMISLLRGLTAHQVQLAVSRVVADDDAFTVEDTAQFLDVKKEMIGGDGLLEYVDAALTLDDLAGLGNLKRWLGRRSGALSPKAREFGLVPPRGILILGVQGCGKSAACQAVASAWQMPLLRLDPGKFYDKFVGESERNLRKAIRQAESMAPVVLWIDEIEKAFASAGAESADGGLSKRMFGTLLHWLQEHRSPIFCVATANDISALPPELVRKGRFDEIFFVDLPGETQREQIAAIHLGRRKRDPAKFDLPGLADASQGFSGAEIEQAIISALYVAFAAGRELTQEDMVTELAATRPLSVMMAERVAGLRAWAAERCVPAD